jgi:hypothetical protein
VPLATNSSCPPSPSSASAMGLGTAPGTDGASSSFSAMLTHGWEPPCRGSWPPWPWPCNNKQQKQTAAPIRRVASGESLPAAVPRRQQRNHLGGPIRSKKMNNAGLLLTV